MASVVIGKEQFFKTNLTAQGGSNGTKDWGPSSCCGIALHACAQVCRAKQHC